MAKNEYKMHDQEAEIELLILIKFTLAVRDYFKGIYRGDPECSVNFEESERARKSLVMRLDLKEKLDRREVIDENDEIDLYRSVFNLDTRAQTRQQTWAEIGKNLSFMYIDQEFNKEPKELLAMRRHMIFSHIKSYLPNISNKKIFSIFAEETDEGDYRGNLILQLKSQPNEDTICQLASSIDLPIDMESEGIHEEIQFLKNCSVDDIGYYSMFRLWAFQYTDPKNWDSFKDSLKPTSR